MAILLVKSFNSGILFPLIFGLIWISFFSSRTDRITLGFCLTFRVWIPFTFVLASCNSVTNTCNGQLTMRTGFFGSHDLGVSCHDDLVH